MLTEQFSSQPFPDLYCLGSWTTNGLVRLLLADDERQRYSAWYRDYGVLQTLPGDQSDGDASQAHALQQQPATTRSQQLISLSNQNQYNSLAPIVDLQIALITPPPSIAKPMQVRLTRRHQCSDLRSYMSQGSFGSSSSYSSSSLSSGYGPSQSSSSSSKFNAATCWPSFLFLFLLTLIVTLLMFYSSHSRQN